MREDDATFAAKVLRHAAVGGILGGPIAAGAAWLVYQYLAGTERFDLSTETEALMAPALVGVLLLGVWIGATIACCFGRPRSAEETCYGGALGCLVYLAGGVLGMVVGGGVLGIKLHPVVWYLIGGNLLALVALGVAVFSPSGGYLCRRRESESNASEDPK